MRETNNFGYSDYLQGRKVAAVRSVAAQFRRNGERLEALAALLDDAQMEPLIRELLTQEAQP